MFRESDADGAIQEKAVKDNPFPTEIMDEAIDSFRKAPAMRLGKLATQTGLNRWCDENAEGQEDRVVRGPDLTPEDWRDLAFILERRIDYCETQMVLVNSPNGAAGEAGIDSRKHFEAERSIAEALFSKVDEAMSIVRESPRRRQDQW